MEPIIDVSNWASSQWSFINSLVLTINSVDDNNNCYRSRMLTKNEIKRLLNIN